MADTSNSQDDSGPGTKDDNPPGPDADAGTEKGVEAVQADAWPPIQKLPAWRGIPDSLYDKAYDDPTQLTEEERQTLLSRGDVVGKALATPDDLTTAEIHEVLLWPPPDVTCANIQRATGGALKSPVNLFAKAKDAIDRQQLDTLLNDEEISLLARFFHGPDDDEFSYDEKERRIKSRGPGRAYELIFFLLGLDSGVKVFSTCRMWDLAPLVRRVNVRPPRKPEERLRPDYLEQYREQLEAVEDAFVASLPPQSDTSWMGIRRVVPDTDYKISAPWPPDHRKQVAAFTVFEEDIEPGCAGSTFDSPEWYRLPEAQKDAYRARAEALRREAWAEFEKACAARVPGEIHRRQGFEHFQLALGAGVTFQEALTKWEAFTEMQRRDWEGSAWCAFEEQRRRQWHLSPEETYKRGPGPSATRKEEV